ncbi:MAG: hypothetical protein J07HQW1_01090 [Haloquadratum walsbyi J07HQW1]|uniref:Uncharacterized protein n=1 Tax=Haloquadratum walsbyi J07HQW1 TaxID=1238424 RepID=U1N3U9_9EURY|nr:MAG: hypothetical protein J07HQW1_01090 [Haloquadratum walsbyi J07HQW1]
MTFLFDSSIVEDERALRPHRLAVEGGERDIALVDVHATHSLGGIRFGHVKLPRDRDV